MEKTGEARSDGLEIVSIGAICNGAWDKKYWSSSRGKDRYPYPVGYQAIRIHCGSIYKLEIREGLKGPLFVINSCDDEQSCSGQTPNIAWASFQKKGCSRGLKLWQSKGSSRKMDGIEFFGFKNPFVQRLLRELVANGNGAAQQNSLSSSVRGGASRMEHGPQCSDSLISNDLPPYSGRSLTRKRSRQHKTKCIKTDSQPGAKRLQSVDPTHNASVHGQGKKLKLNDIDLTSSALYEEYGISDGPKAVPTSAAAASGKISPLPQSVPNLNSSEFAYDVKEDAILPQDQRAYTHLKNSTSNEGNYKLSLNNESSCRAEEAKIYTFREGKDAKRSGPQDHSGNNSVNLCVADTLDRLQDSPEFASTCPEEGPYNVIDRVVPTEDMLDELHSKEEISRSLPNPSSEKSELDSAGQDTARSMMTLLLPQALPLLEASKKRSTEKPLDISHCKVNFEMENNKNVKPSDGILMEECNTESFVKFDFLSSDIPLVVSELEDIQRIVPDSLENDKCVLTHDNLEPQPGGDPEKSSVSCLEKSDGEYILSQDERGLPEGRPLEKSDAALGCSSGIMRVFVRTSKGVRNLNESSECVEANFDKQILQPGPSCSSEKTEDPVDTDMVDDHTCLNPKSSRGNIKKSETSCLGNIIDVKDRVGPEGGKRISQKLETILLDNIKEANDELEGIVDLVGCYIHPLTVSSLLFNASGNEVLICVLCGQLENTERTLFLYKVPLSDQRGNPSFIGHAPLVLPKSKDHLSREIVLERSCLQFTPDGQYLVVVSKLKAPYCREKKIDCSCRTCSTNSNKGNAVKIVQVQLGYISLLANLETDDSVRCLLVCGSTHLVAVEESGRLLVWVMNANWSAQVKQFVLPTNASILEVKKIPRSQFLIVGHNGFGEFGIWDIYKRSLISSFSAANTSILDFFPISMFSCGKEGHASTSPEVEYINNIMESTEKCWLEGSDSCVKLPFKAEDLAVWLLVSTASDYDGKHYFQESGCQDLGEWRLAVLLKNSVIFGNQLDPRASVVNTSADHWIIGTQDGLAYMAEVSTGTKLGTLHHFKGDAVSRVVVHDSYLIGIASETQLLVYLHSPRGFSNLEP